MKTIKELEIRSTLSYGKGYNQCKEDVLELIDEDALEKEQERLEKEINDCSCENKTGFMQLELGRCHLCDVRFAKHEGIRFAGEELKNRIKEEK